MTHQKLGLKPRYNDMGMIKFFLVVDNSMN